MKIRINLYGDEFRPRRQWGTLPQMALAWGLCLLVLLVGQSAPWGIVATALALGMVTKGTAPVVQTILAGAVVPGQAYEEVFTGSAFVRGCVNMSLPLLFGALAAVTSMELVYVLMAVAALVAVVPVLWPVAENV